MRIVYTFFLLIFLSSSATFSQTVILSGQCMSGTITVSYVMDVNGKPAYQGTGTVLATAGVAVSVYWLGAPDNLWVIDFDGQPYFQNSCNTNIPPGTVLSTCSWVPVSGTTCTGGTALSVAGAVVVPVSLTKFTAVKRPNDVVLDWTTAQEVNNKGFTIQKTNDNVHWVDIGFVNGKGFSSTATDYQFTDKAPYTGLNLYRLKQEDFDSKINYSSIQKVEFSRNSFYTITDNPGNGIYKINMPPGMENLELSVTDMSGRLIYRKASSAGNQLLDISSQAPGMYRLQIKKGNLRITEKIIKL